MNHRHTDFQSVALPTELSGPFEEGLYWINGMSSTTLRKERSGAVGEILHLKFIRTPFRHTFILLLLAASDFHNIINLAS